MTNQLTTIDIDVLADITGGTCDPITGRCCAPGCGRWPPPVDRGASKLPLDTLPTIGHLAVARPLIDVSR